MSNTPMLVILAGGASSRMWPLKEKSLLRFGEDPLLISQLRRFESLGFHEAIIVGNTENQADIQGMIDAMGDGIQVHLAIQPEPMGMGDAILRTQPLLEAPNRAIYINQVHDVVEEGLHTHMLERYRRNPQAAYLAGVEMDNYFPGGYLIVDENGQISGMVEKPGPDNRPSNLVNIVAHIHPDAGRLFETIRAEYASDSTSDDHYERAMDKLMKDLAFYVVPYRGRWDALKFPWHTLSIMEAFLAEIRGQEVAGDAYIAPTATLIGDVIISSGAKVFPGASIVGPAYIGRNTIVGNNAMVRGSMVLDNCNVGFTTEVARSYVADGCQMHACRVLDSVFAPNVNFSAGCTTANLRIDKSTVPSTVKGQRVDSGRDKLGAIVGENAFLAVDVMTMPGVKVGTNAQVGPGTHVVGDIRDGQRVYVKQELVIIDPE
ncbi:MAG: NTP transferase domain-containing protein [Anaerolineae bacterium]|nr:NTP transferase domain-containing protein [Anaerolineae bacterium]